MGAVWYQQHIQDILSPKICHVTIRMEVRTKYHPKHPDTLDV
jgi:hypothetical protein